MRLTLIILLPLLCIGMAAGLWRLADARQTAADVFDRSLLSTAIAVANDVAISEGDALSPRTSQLLADTSGGRVFYHVFAPDGLIVAGYATPPVGIPPATDELVGPIYFNATYLGREVHGVRLLNRAEIDGFAGIFTTTVWQNREVRETFVRDLMLRALGTILGLISALGLAVWFGVRIGLRPLTDLEDAISRRSSDELTPIRRPVPREVSGIVERLNGLFAQVSRSMTAQAEFISNAAHQLKNPIAGVLALAEAVDRAPDEAELRRRARDLLTAARETAELSQKLLLLERAKEISPSAQFQTVDLGPALEEWLMALDEPRLTWEIAPLGPVNCDPTMIREALINLVQNAVQHGGTGLSRIAVVLRRDGPWLTLTVSDDGQGVAPEERAHLFERFRQSAPSSGSGLGLSIVRAVAQGHGGDATVAAMAPGLSVEMRLPRD